MHIEPGIVNGAKMALAYVTAAGSATVGLKLAYNDMSRSTTASFLVRSVMAGLGTFMCFEVLPRFAVGVSEVHIILGTSLMLILGAGPAALGLAAGLLVQGLFFVPTDLPMYFVNVTTLLMPLFALAALSSKILPKGKAYVDLAYRDVLKMSMIYQGGIIAWVAFWALYGQGVGQISSIMTFGLAYMSVVLIEPLIDLALLAGAKALGRDHAITAFVNARLYRAAA